jgi:hypothetical protein
MSTIEALATKLETALIDDQNDINQNVDKFDAMTSLGYRFSLVDERFYLADGDTQQNLSDPRRK